MLSRFPGVSRREVMVRGTIPIDSSKRSKLAQCAFDRSVQSRGHSGAWRRLGLYDVRELPRVRGMAAGWDDVRPAPAYRR